MTAMRVALASRWPLLVILLTAAVWFYRSPYSASDLEIVPDSEEYAIGALELLDTGSFHLKIEDRWLPSRYPPWFSAVVLVPAYAVIGHDPGNGVLAILALAVAGVGFSWSIGRRVYATAGAIFAALAVLVIPSYSIRAGQIMTDVPCTAMMLGVCWLYLRRHDKPGALTSYVVAGVVVALTTLFRIVFAAMLLPFLVDIVRAPERRFPRIIALLLPMSCAAGATLVYNAAVFGSPLRNGYKFWAAVPSDYLSMTFSSTNLLPSLTVLIHSPLPILLVIAIVAYVALRMRKSDELRSAREQLRDLFTFLILTVAPIVVFHLFYFYRSDRFYLPLFAAAAIVAGLLAAMAFGQRATTIGKLLCFPALGLAILGRVTTPDATPHRRLAAERIRRFTADNAIVISTTDPLYMERFAARGSHRRIVPLSRNIEFASKLIVRKRIDNPQPPLRGLRDARAEGLIRGGAEEAVNFVASEHTGFFADEVARGTPVYIDITMADATDNALLAELSRRCVFVQRAPYLYQFVLR